MDKEVIPKQIFINIVNVGFNTVQNLPTNEFLKLRKIYNGDNKKYI